MKIQVNKTTTEEVEITLPYFFKTMAHWVAIFSNEKGIKITDCRGFELNNENGSELLSRFIDANFTEIDAHEFFAKYDDVNEINNNLINKYRNENNSL